MDMRDPKTEKMTVIEPKRAEYTQEFSEMSRDPDASIISFTTKPQTVSLRVIALGLLFILVAVLTSLSKQFSGADSPQCRPVYMYPSYARIDGLDERYTTLAKKYHLYLYREQSKDRDPLENGELQLDGIPVLFIPGNAGSFRQARSIAAASATLYFDEAESIENPNTKNLDVFTADFNEDFTAFHGRTMLDQAEYLNDAVGYILSLYRSTQDQTGPSPQAVLVIGHSMGGVVARVMPTLKNYIPESINTYITLSAPHAVSPVTFDGDMLKIYKRITNFWESEFKDRSSFFARNVSLISITGGVLDSILPSDFTIIEEIVPYSNGFTTYTTTIPDVWTPIDHLAIVWCDQLRRVLAHILLESVDVQSPSKSIPLEDRLRLYRKNLLSGLEDYAAQDMSINSMPSAKGSFFDSLEDFSEVKINEKLVLTDPYVHSRSRFNLFTVPESTEDLQFAILTTVPSLNVQFCQRNLVKLDKKGSSQGWKAKCFSATSDFVKVPRSASDSQYPSDSSSGEQEEPFHLLLVNETLLSSYDFIVVESSEEIYENNNFVIAELTNRKTKRLIDDNPFKIFFTGLLSMRKIVDSSLLVSTFDMTGLYSSIVSYRVKSLVSEGSPLFEPFFKQSIDKPFETKWHVNLKQGPQDINFHSVAPFVTLNSSDFKSLKLTFINPPGIDLSIILEVNWPLTIKMLFIRFRLSIAAFTIGFVALIAAYQFRNYSTTGQFVAFDTAMDRVLNRHWIAMFTLIGLLIPLSSLINYSSIAYFANLKQWVMPTSNSSSVGTFFLGVSELFMWWLGPFFLLMTIASVYVVYRLIALLEAVAGWTATKSRSVREMSRNDQFGSRIIDGHFQNARQLAGALIIIIAVIFYIPYQFAFIVLTVLQALFCVKLAVSCTRKEVQNLQNFNNTILMLMIFLVPINAPIVMVFMRNFAIRWETPFRSHHNFLAVLPIILLIESNARYRMPLKTSSRDLISVAILVWLLHMSLYSFIFGTRNLYWLHHLFNSLCAMLFLKTFA
ncbi:LANO_0B02938g1_1 [Lachancea nothofagi CBS 11611]|uniref:GPI inositol-deacylase n=1 Tax=Lachancea nothofagi CBS 11611 TaxID=1266666 RepID=A0A1G4IWZ6_9SACH|nr:LANO_0B02938g1_1 [Lachancea nothofagi CBS 11611]